MMNLEIHQLDCDNVSPNLGFNKDGWQRIEDWVPPDRCNVILYVTLAIGFRGENGSDYFKIVVCTQEYFLQHETELQTRRKIIVTYFDWKIVSDIIRAKVKTCERETRDDSLLALRKEFEWEFEGIQPLKHKRRKNHTTAH